MKLTHLQSATVLIEIDGFRLLCDPWMVQGEYYGSWFHYPPCAVDPENVEYDAVYVSHIHPDHMSRKTLERLDRSKPVIIHDFKAKFLKRNIESLGFSVIEIGHAKPYPLGYNGWLTIYASDNCDPEVCGKFFGCAGMSIDTMAIVSDGRHTILNVNDCPYDLAKDTLDLVLRQNPDIDLLLVGYAGAGPYPQCYQFSDVKALQAAARKKQDTFIGYAVKYVKHVTPEAFMPFAGTYVLGGRLYGKNAFRGIPPITLARRRIAAETGVKPVSGTYNLTTGECIEATEPTVGDIAAFAATTYNDKFDYDDDGDITGSELQSLVTCAIKRFQRKAREVGLKTNTMVKIISDGVEFRFGVNGVFDPDRFLEITLDKKLMVRLLRGPQYAHWNNAEIGSHLQFRRQPDIYERGLFHCLSFLHA